MVFDVKALPSCATQTDFREHLNKLMEFSTFTDAGVSNIPRLQGIYAFFLDIVSPAKIGLAGRGPWDLSTLEKAKKALLWRAKKQLTISHSAELTGGVAQIDKVGPTQIAYKVIAKKLSMFDAIQELDSIPLKTVREYSQLIHDTAIFAQPLYVGITYEQTLYDRYIQHRTAYRGTTSDLGFGARLRDLEIEWDDVIFSCRPLSQPSSDSLALRKAERHLHSLTHPICSVK